jgi:hypothetical protein
MLAVLLGLGAAISIVPAGLFDDHKGVRGAILDTETDSVGHCSAASVSIL